MIDCFKYHFGSASVLNGAYNNSLYVQQLYMCTSLLQICVFMALYL